MSWMKQTFSSSIGRKFAMALSALFLLIFLLQHFLINFTSVFAPDIFNEVSHFMGTSPAVQFALQPILIFAVVYHFVAGFVLEAQNRRARGAVQYAMQKGSANSSWMSRNMIISGAVILAFLAVHFYDFWVPEITTKYIYGDMSGMTKEGDYRYYHELVEKFHNPIRVAIYSVAFVLLGLHLRHGFQSAFQSVGANHRKYTPLIQSLGNIYSIAIPVGFIFIALYHHFNGH